MLERAMGVCPVCSGTGRAPAESKQWGRGWDKVTDTVSCYNCGGQTMWGNATGKTPLRRDNGEPCVHEYDSWQRGRCWTQYVCKHCVYSFDIDSGD